MTKDEAIEIFEYYQRQHDRGLPVMVTKRDIVALDMAIEALEEYDKVADALNGYTELYRKLKEKYDNLKKQNQWIPCSEMLPSEDAYYFVTLGTANCLEDGRDVEIAPWADGHWDWWNSDLVLAWCELPKPWKGEQNE